MGIINYTYEPNQTVWVISGGKSCPLAVEEGLVIRVRGNALTTGTTVRYDIRVRVDKGTSEFIEADVFASLSDATTEYQNRLTL